MKMAELLPLKVYTFEFSADFTKFWPRGYKTFFMLNSVELSFLLINVKMPTVNNCWHFKIYEQEK